MVSQQKIADLSGYTVLYGGSFNPPHIAHQQLIKGLLKQLYAKSVWVIPSFNHPFAKQMLSYTHRLAMAKLLLEPFSANHSTWVCEIEQELHNNCTTFHVVSTLQDKFPDKKFAWVIGSDILKETHLWYRWEELCQLITMVVVTRAGYPVSSPIHKLSHSLKENNKNMKRDQALFYCGGKLPLPEVSSSDLRYALRIGGDDRGDQWAHVKQYIPDTILAYISDHKLYL